MAVPRPDEVLEGRENRARLETRLAELRESFEQEGDDLAVEVIDLYLVGANEPREQAEILKADLDDVYQARRRVTRRAEVVRAADRETGAAHPNVRTGTDDEEEAAS
jgi:hypothetical protein